ncbi:hypothetical protein V1519DRAFT_470399 [Lipomyces tetrasporus]
MVLRDAGRLQAKKLTRQSHIPTVSSLTCLNEEYYVQKGLSGCITTKANERDTEINSCQNGLLMQSNVHEISDKFLFSVNPDDDYKITCFDGDPLGIDGKINPICRDPNDERTVLANMKGVGEPNFETNFPSGTDMMGEILGGPDAAKRMEAELFSRLMG